MEVCTHQAERSAIPLIQINDCSEESQQPSSVSRLSKDSFLLHRQRGDVMCCVGDIGSQWPGHPVKILRGFSSQCVVARVALESPQSRLEMQGQTQAVRVVA